MLADLLILPRITAAWKAAADVWFFRINEFFYLSRGRPRPRRCDNS